MIPWWSLPGGGSDASPASPSTTLRKCLDAITVAWRRKRRFQRLVLAWKEGTKYIEHGGAWPIYS